LLVGLFTGELFSRRQLVLDRTSSLFLTGPDFNLFLEDTLVRGVCCLAAIPFELLSSPFLWGWI
jgi:hypothetical protein